MPPKLTQPLLNELLDYNPKTGTLTWNPRDRKWFTSDGYHRQWNNRYAGREAFSSRNGHGYRQGNIFKIKLQAHRVIWLMMTGEEPECIDHINGIRDDNRWNNLRASSRSLNGRNHTLNKRNSTGFNGVGIERKSGRYFAKIRGHDKQDIWLGYFPNPEVAHKAIEATKANYGYSPRHGLRSTVNA